MSQSFPKSDNNQTSAPIMRELKDVSHEEARHMLTELGIHSWPDDSEFFARKLMVVI